MDKIIVIVGPTASGKTALSVALAKALDGEIISADSMQLYRGMDIGTAKVTPEEMQGIPHHMVDVLEPWEDCSAARYVQEADPILQEILARGKTAIVVGGTGLYVDALIQGRSFAPYPSTGKRQALEQEADEKGMEEMLQRLQAVDPDSAARLHIRDRKRILRALEVYQETGKTITQHNLETQQIPDKYDPLWLGLTYEPRQVLYDRIDLRVDLMLEQGLLPEIEALLKRGIPKTATALQAIGYKEFLPVLAGEMPLEAAVETVKQESRRYAKRQLTWFRRNPKIDWICQHLGQKQDEVLQYALARVASFDSPM
jgi:tRNA dimethylallyltransferase